MQIVDVDEASNRIAAVLFGQERPCAFSVAWKSSDDGRLPETICAQGISILQTYKEIAMHFGVESVEIAGIATEVFRKARNGGAFLEVVWRL